MPVVEKLLSQFGYVVDKSSERSVEGSIGKIKGAAVALGAVLAAGAAFKGLNALVNQAAQLGDELAKTSKQIGVGAQALQEIRFAARIAGASTADVTKGLRTLAKNANEAGQGVKSFEQDFERLGVNVKDQQGNLKTTEVLFNEVGAALGGLESESEKVALAQTLLGRAGTKLLPLFNEGADAIKRQRDRANELGGVFDKQLLGLSEEMIDAQTEQGEAFQGLRNIVAKELLPIWIDFTGRITDLAIEMRGPLSRGTKVALELFKGVGRVLMTVGEAIFFVVEKQAELLSGFFGVNKQLFVAISLLGVMAAILGLPVVLLGLISAAIFLVIDDFRAMGEGGESVTGTLVEGFTGLVDELGGVGNAMREIIATSVEFWLKELLGLSDETIDIINQFMAPIFSFITGAWIADLVEFFQNDFPAMWEAAAAFVRGIFDRIIKEITIRFGNFQKLFGLGDDSPAATAAVGARAGVPGGRGPAISAPRITTEVNVDASGVRDPEAVASLTAEQVAAANEASFRNSQEQLLSGGPSLLAEVVSP